MPLKAHGHVCLFPFSPCRNILAGFVATVAETTAFSGVFAVQREKVAMTSKSGFQSGFLEKNIQEWWSKQVVVIK